MDKKLTLSLKQQVIERAKSYAKRHKTSLSRMIESYFESLTSESIEPTEIATTPLVESLCGVIELSEDFNYKESKAKYLINKHS